MDLIISTVPGIKYEKCKTFSPFYSTATTSNPPCSACPSTPSSTTPSSCPSWTARSTPPAGLTTPRTATASKWAAEEQEGENLHRRVHHRVDPTRRRRPRAAGRANPPARKKVRQLDDRDECKTITSSSRRSLGCERDGSVRRDSDFTHVVSLRAGRSQRSRGGVF